MQLNKSIIWILAFVLLISGVYAEQQSLGVFKNNICVNLIQTCSNCTYNNVSAITSPYSYILLGESKMTKSGTIYNYSFCDTSAIGTYIVNGHGDLNGIDTVWNYDFKVTNSGKLADNAPSSAVMFFILVITGVLFYLGISNKVHFNKFEITNFILKKCCLIAGVYLMILNSTIMSAISDNANLGITKEIFTYTWLFGWGGYILLVYLMVSTIIKTLKMWNINKRNKRTGVE